MNILVARFDSILVDQLEETRADLTEERDTSMSAYLNEELQRLTELRRALHVSQDAFNTYASDCVEVVGEMMGMGRERSIQESMAAYDLIRSRIALLEDWTRFY
jgi:hypothetical protein